MNAIIENLRTCLEERDISGFLEAYEGIVSGADFRTGQLTGITQRIFPTVLRDMLASRALLA
ncbi:MAG: hypothetical protein CVU33_00895, partial [Betaproteobacteria bacterium HGW-Betaproteobacteria-6]